MVDKRYTLRMEETLFNKLAQTAKENRRSIAKQIELLVAQYYEPPKEVEVSDEMQDAIQNFINVLKKEGHIDKNFGKN